MSTNSSSTKSASASDPVLRYIIGVDLGTTNCAMSYVDLRELENLRTAPDSGDAGAASLIHDFQIPQCVAPNVSDSRKTLPSFFSRLSDVPSLPWDTTPPRDFSLPSRGSRAPHDDLRGAVGALARDYGAANPDAFVSSAKSWLCNANVDRTARLLPLRSTTRPASDSSSADASVARDVQRWSPVEVSSFYLSHLRSAWNDRFPDYPLETQDIVLTIPASFDETARSLTLEAAKLAKLPRVSLVEEPQAAFYAWLSRHEQNWTDRVAPGDKVLVCDVGGGTTDFALIYALKRDDAQAAATDTGAANRGVVKFYRVAVGDHLVLGGDNLDLALSAYLAEKLQAKRGAPLTPRERAILLRESRETKEAFLGADAGPDVRRVLLPSSTSKLVGGSLAIDVTRAEVEALLIDGFFPRVALDAQPNRRRAAVREIALPYAFDPAVTKHLAYFLRAHKNAGDDLVRAGVVGASNATSEDRSRDGIDPARPDAILFNGGAFESPKLRDRVVETLASWFDADGRGWRPTVLENDELYLAVSRGAAYYGLALRGLGERVGASLARSYYAETALGGSESVVGANVGSGAHGASSGSGKVRHGVCVLSAQAEPGDEITLPQIFELEVDKPASFPIHVSSVRTTDAPGDLVPLDPNETRELSPIRTALKTRSAAKKAAGRVKARLVARPTEIGTIELFLQEVLPADAGGRARASRWTLQFDARGGAQSDWEAGDAQGEETGIVDDSLVESALTVVDRVFADDAALNASDAERLKPGRLFPEIAEAVGTSKEELPVTALRRLAERTLELAEGRKRGAPHEARWLNWLGFALRPGFGASTDDWRVEQTWKTIGGRLAFNTPECRAQYWVLWRRVASGLTPGRQLTLAEPLLANVRNLRKQLVEGKGRGADIDLASQEGAEIWRMLGSFELLPTDLRVELGDAILDVLPKKKTAPVRDALVWALGRVGARRLFHAPLDRVVPASVARRWARRLLDDLALRADTLTPGDFFALAQLTRRAEDASLDVDVSLRETVAAFLVKHGAEDATLAALERHGKLVDDATRQAFGETLPLGLRWTQDSDA